MEMIFYDVRNFSKVSRGLKWAGKISAKTNYAVPPRNFKIHVLTLKMSVLVNSDMVNIDK